MCNDYYRQQKEKEIEDELKWLEVEKQYVQRTSYTPSGKSKEAIPDKRERDNNDLPKS